MKQDLRMSVLILETVLPKICDAATSADVARWAPENPLWGHCAVVSLLAQELLGGELRRADLDPAANAGSSHYWNVLPDGTEKDFTLSQFGGKPAPTKGAPVTRARDGVLYAPPGATPDREALFAGTRKRYELLKSRFVKTLKSTIVQL